jgi:large subunit ribosomal protein L10
MRSLCYNAFVPAGCKGIFVGGALQGGIGNLAITREKKENLVEQYVGLLKDSHAVVFVQSQGLSVPEVEQLRNTVRDRGGNYSVIKNTLFRLALEEAKMKVPAIMTGPLAVTFCPEDLAPVVKAIDDFGDEIGDDRDFSIVGGILEGEVLDAERARSLASLPSKDVLFSQILAGLNAPGSQLVGTIANSVRQILNVLQARVDQLEEAESAA